MLSISYTIRGSLSLKGSTEPTSGRTIDLSAGQERVGNKVCLSLSSKTVDWLVSPPESSEPSTVSEVALPENDEACRTGKHSTVPLIHSASVPNEPRSSRGHRRQI
jgi:hypothetical protein